MLTGNFVIVSNQYFAMLAAKNEEPQATMCNRFICLIKAFALANFFASAN